MAELTKEWLLRTIAELEEERDAVPGLVNEDADKALAAMKLALASLEAKDKIPELRQVIYHFRDWNEGFPIERFKADYVISWMLANYPPAQPAPVSVPAAMEMDDDFDSAFEHGKAVGWNAYRAAMLQGAEPVTTANKLPTESAREKALAIQLLSVIKDLGLPENCPFVDVLNEIYRLQSNSPVIPDGWIIVPKVPTEAMCETGHIGVDVYTGLATEGDGYYSIGGEDAARVWEFMIEMAPKQENTMDYITKLSPKLVSVGMFEQLSFHDGFSLKCRELGIHASKLGHIELSKKAQDLMFSASLQQHDQLVDNMASLIELMADNYMRNTANSPVTPDAWIPVSERMPEIRKNWLDMPVIIAVRGEKDAAEAMYCSDGKFRWGRDEQPIEYVTHWMPLPAAPQQEDKNV
ncbi:DUF551 domain-containing protein [Citrobacter cronae]|nr:DUF551 domain-containing protein [Citrobacter cronae]MDX7440946.1 DUF551 domain-containing protein [Citrobacter cronae]